MKAWCLLQIPGWRMSPGQKARLLFLPPKPLLLGDAVVESGLIGLGCVSAATINGLMQQAVCSTTADGEWEGRSCGLDGLLQCNDIG